MLAVWSSSWHNFALQIMWQLQRDGANQFESDFGLTVLAGPESELHNFVHGACSKCSSFVAILYLKLFKFLFRNNLGSDYPHEEYQTRKSALFYHGLMDPYLKRKLNKRGVSSSWVPFFVPGSFLESAICTINSAPHSSYCTSEFSNTGVAGMIVHVRRV